jgi:threonine synthase
MYCCPHTGVALAVMIKLLEKQKISKTDKTVVISTAHGLKFSEFKVGYHEKNLPGVNSLHANMPVMLPPDANMVREAIEKELSARK